ncbi:transcription-repair coupling factor [candidate division TA06 bacterium]|nr:transcription-repair coupling factor [candidate division TA06 bacterium]
MLLTQLLNQRIQQIHRISRNHPWTILLYKLKEGPIRVSGLSGGSKALLIAHLFESLKIPTLVVTHDEEEAEGLSQDLASLLNEIDSSRFSVNTSAKIHYLPPREESSEDSIPSPEIEELRITALHSLSQPDSGILIITPSKAIEQKLTPPEILKVQKGGILSRDKLLSQLVEMGFERVSSVQVYGEMSVRGGILDLFPFQVKYPYRIELFGDQVESIRTFNPITQRSIQSIEKVQILPFLEKEGDGKLIDCFPEESLFICERDNGQLTIDHPNRDVQSPKSEFQFHFETQTQSSYFGDLPRFRKDIEEWADRGITPIFLADNEWERERFKEIFPHESGLKILIGSLREGFFWEEMGIALTTGHDLFGRDRRRLPKVPQEGIPIEDLLALRPKDYVVHIDYGIGQFEGIQKVKINSRETDCLLIRYAGGDKLLVPIEKMHRVQRYSGSSELSPPLTRLGTGHWERLKKRVKSSLREMADQLLKLYAIRKSEEGFAFSPDTSWQRELEASFPFEETEDQVKAVELIKKDMESKECMDRLVCGEVGYGKTEIALRAAFKAVMDHKQVALLVPTTILAEQHYKTFQNRLQRFPIRTEVLSRFKHPREQKKVLRDLAEGKVDILIGTHRILSRGLQFHDLGLLIIDEEHRFGVKQKERLKEMKKTVDCLALSATPIPRTLYMSLSGLRDMVTLSTAPQGRLAIQTEVSPWDPNRVVQAIEREVERGGQVFFVHNRIETLDGVARTLKTLLPHIPLSIAHGQMPERELEKVILNFMNGETPLLVTTAIIEAGMDIPNANTILINRADRFGLAQLHQLRGRVGRSSRKGYCYLLVPKRVTQDARKRLAAIRSYSELGSGFKLALRDLEIRGAGNLLGSEQHGQIARVGFDLYCRLLEAAVRELKPGSVPSQDEVEVTFHLDEEARIPEDYVEDSYQKVALYKRLLDLHDLKGLQDLEEELRDRFGPLPQPCQTLLQTVALRILAQKAMVRTITFRNRSVELEFTPDQKMTKKGVEKLVRRTPFSIEFFDRKGIGIRFQTDLKKRYEKAKALLQSMN